MSYSPTSMSDDNKPPPDPRYSEWDKKSRTELRGRLCEAVDRRREATEELIPRVIAEQLRILNISNDGEITEYHVSTKNVMKVTQQSIDEQIRDWKGLRWWRFSGNNACDSWNKWFKKAKCWQDQNQHKPLGRFWCLILNELKQYTLSLAKHKFPDHPREHQAVQKCLYSKCVEAILRGNVRFERTRETPLLPVRALTQSKELQQKLSDIDPGFTLSQWKQEAEQRHKKQKQQKQQQYKNGANKDKSQRANVATLLNERCSKHAAYVYRQSVGALKQLIPSLNITNCKDIEPDFDHNGSRKNRRYEYNPSDHIDSNSNNNGYGPSRGGIPSALRVESQRYSPTLSSNSISSISSISDISSLSDVASIGSGSSDRSAHSVYSHRSHYSHHSVHSERRNHRNSRRIDSLPPKPPIPRPISDESEKNRLSLENKRLKDELNALRARLSHYNASSDMRLMLQCIPSPMTVPMAMAMPMPMPQIPASVMLNDGRGGHAAYYPQKGTMFCFPSSSSMSSNTDTNQSKKEANTLDIDNVINNSNMNVDILMDSNDTAHNPPTPGISSYSYPEMSPRSMYHDAEYAEYDRYHHAPYPYVHDVASPKFPQFVPLRESFDNINFFEHPHPAHIH